MALVVMLGFSCTGGYLTAFIGLILRHGRASCFVRGVITISLLRFKYG